MSGYVIGIDGGGSKTAVILAGRDGSLVGRGEGGPSNYHVVGKERAFAALDESISAAWAQAGLQEQPLAAVVLGMAGVDRPVDRAIFQDWITRRFPQTSVRLVNDGQIALAAGTPDGWGVVVVAGTGSIIFAQDAQGHFTRAGGWGHLMGDEGSGYRAALEALQAVVRQYDGRGPATSLTERLLAFYQVAAPPDLVAVVYHPDSSRAALARLSRLVDEEALAGDAVAQGIIQRAADELAAGVQAVVVQNLHLQTVPAALAGGFLVNGQSLRAALLASVRSLGIKLDPVNTVEEPVWGAVRLAVRMIE